MSRPRPDMEEEVLSETEDDVDEPSMYSVFLHNDDYTTMEFVVEVLITLFNKSIEEATAIMLKVHQEGSGLCGVYTFEVAETKVDIVQHLALEEGFPLMCTMEKN
jgi:ATP-dependent Clp protease adaptor protein ClpS